MVFWLLFSNKGIENILILSAIVAPFASAGIRLVVHRLKQDTAEYYGLAFCLFSWPYIVKWYNSGIIMGSSLPLWYLTSYTFAANNNWHHFSLEPFPQFSPLPPMPLFWARDRGHTYTSYKSKVYSRSTQHVLIQITWFSDKVQPIITSPSQASCSLYKSYY